MKAMEKPELRPRASGGYGKGTVTQAHKYKCMHKYASVRAQTQNTYNTQIRIIYAHDRTQAIQYSTGTCIQYCIQNTNTVPVATVLYLYCTVLYTHKQETK